MVKGLLVFLMLGGAGTVFAEEQIKDGVKNIQYLDEVRTLLGEVFLSESDQDEDASDNDTFSLPSCGEKNVWINQLNINAPRLKPNGQNNLDAWVKKVVIVFGNGQTLTKDFNRSEGWLRVTAASGEVKGISLGSLRCVRSVSVIGEQYEGGKNKSDSYVRVVGISR